MIKIQGLGLDPNAILSRPRTVPSHCVPFNLMELKPNTSSLTCTVPYVILILKLIGKSEIAAQVKANPNSRRNMKHLRNLSLKFQNETRWNNLSKIQIWTHSFAVNNLLWMRSIKCGKVKAVLRLWREIKKFKLHCDLLQKKRYMISIHFRIITYIYSSVSVQTRWIR